MRMNRKARQWLCVALGMQIGSVICYAFNVLIWASLIITLVALFMIFRESGE